MMLNWLKRKIRDWLKEDETISNTLEANIYGKVTKVFATGVVGIRLQCNVDLLKGGGVYLLGDHQACDKNHFWKLWKHLGGKAQFDDGEKFDPDLL